MQPTARAIVTALRLMPDVIQTRTKNVGSLLIRVVEASSIHRGTLLLRNALVDRGSRGAFRRFSFGRGTWQRRDRIWLLRTSGSFGSRRRQVARHRPLSNSGAPRLRGRRRMGPALAPAPRSSRPRASLTPCGGGRRLGIAAVGRHRAALRVMPTPQPSRTFRGGESLIRGAV